MCFLLSFSSNYETQQANGTSFIQIIPSDGTGYLLHSTNVNMHVEWRRVGFLKRSCCRGGRGGTAGRCLHNCFTDRPRDDGVQGS